MQLNGLNSGSEYEMIISTLNENVNEMIKSLIRDDLVLMRTLIVAMAA